MSRLPIVVALAVSTVVACAGGPEPRVIPRSGTEGYSLVIDAGSQGSRLRIYRWERSPGEPLPEIHAAPWPRPADEVEWSVEVAPGLSAYAGNATAAAETLAPLVDFALQRLEVPAASRSMPSILVLATAGVRRLPVKQQDELTRGVRRYLRGRGFDRVRVRVLSGRDEALYGWLGGNFVLGRLDGGRETETLGGLDLGGASSQIAFDVESSSHPDVEAVVVGEAEFQVFVRSDLGFGQDVAEANLAEPGCYPEGFDSPAGPGEGDFEACLSGLVEAFRSCGDEICPPTPDQVPAPSGRFLAVANYFHTSVLFGLSAPLSLAELEDAGAAYCATGWDELHETYPTLPSKYLGKFCFSSAYIVALLTEGYGFPYDTQAITAVDRLGGERVAWTIGALLIELTR